MSKNNDNYTPEAQSTNYGIVIFTSKNRRCYTEQDAALLRKIDIHAYLQYLNFGAMTKRQFLELARRMLQLPTIECAELTRLYQAAGRKKFAPENLELRQQILIRIGKLLHRNIAQPLWNSYLSSFISMIKSDKEIHHAEFYRHPAFLPFRNNIITVKLTKRGKYYQSQELHFKVEQMKIIVPEKRINRTGSCCFIIVPAKHGSSRQSLQILAGFYGYMSSSFMNIPLNDAETHYIALGNGWSSQGSVRRPGNDFRIMAESLKNIINHADGVSLVFTYHPQNNILDYQVFIKSEK